jgi:DnaK suppressor protein
MRRILLDKRAQLVVRRSREPVARRNDEVLERTGESADTEICCIDRALDRLAQGRYGVCSECGESIDAARLVAWPYADTCVNCAV